MDDVSAWAAPHPDIERLEADLWEATDNLGEHIPDVKRAWQARFEVQAGFFLKTVCLVGMAEGFGGLAAGDLHGAPVDLDAGAFGFKAVVFDVHGFEFLLQSVHRFQGIAPTLARLRIGGDDREEAQPGKCPGSLVVGFTLPMPGSSAVEETRTTRPRTIAHILSRC